MEIICDKKDQNFGENRKECQGFWPYKNMRDNKKPGKNLKNIRFDNNKAVINTLRRHDYQSIKELSDSVGLSNAGISKIIGNLVQKGLVKNEGKGESSDEGGKRPTLFSINAQFRFGLVIMVELDGIYACIYDLTLKQRYMLVEKAALSTYEKCLDSIARIIKQSMENSDIEYSKLCGIMIGFPGIVSFEKGTIIYPICSPEWGNNLSICSDIQRLIGHEIPVYTENSGRLVGYSELLASEEEQRETIISLGHDSREQYNILNGAGGSVIVNGQLVRGKGSIGEFGHMTVDPNDTEQCRCGRYGCFESMTSVRRLLMNAESQRSEFPDSVLNINREIKIEDIFDAANRKDVFARKLLEPIINHFVIVINNLILAYDPDKISLFGIYTKAGDYFINEIRERIFKHCTYKQLEINYNKLEYLEMERKGAALLIIDNFLNQDELYQ